MHLITYSQADTTERFDSESFARIVTTAFQAVPTTISMRKGCCMGHHMDAGVHFHMCVLLSKLQRWSRVTKYLQEHEHIVFNFSGHPAYQFRKKNQVTELSKVFFKVDEDQNPEKVTAPRL